MKHVLLELKHVLVACLAAAACSSTPSPPQTPTYQAAGKFGVGVHTFTFVDASRATPANNDYAGAPNRTLVVELWYPATTDPDPSEEPTKDAPLAAGKFPLIVHSHGFMDSRNGESYFGRHLASHGYIVAAPDYPLSNGAAPGGPTITDLPNQPGDLSFVIDSLLADPTYGAAADAGHIGASGLSLGGLTTLLSTFHPRLRDARIAAALPMAAPSCMLEAAFFGQAVPVLFLHGDSDLIVPIEANSARVFPLAKDPRELVTLHTASHTGFSGFATLFDPKMHYDRIGCMVLGSIRVLSFNGLGSEAEGISPDPSVCPMPCQGTAPDPSLEAERQQQLTNTVGAAFFEARLRGDAGAKAFLEGPLASENPEAQIRLK
jgi:predicted dienelactone hydrolase